MSKKKSSTGKTKKKILNTSHTQYLAIGLDSQYNPTVIIGRNALKEEVSSDGYRHNFNEVNKHGKWSNEVGIYKLVEVHSIRRENKIDDVVINKNVTVNTVT